MRYHVKGFSISKGVALTKFQKNERFQQDILLFLENDISKAEIKEAKERLVSLFGGEAKNSLEQIRLYKFHLKIALNNKLVQSEYLCPTSNAPALNSFRVFYQAQSWKERDNLNPKDWSRKEKKKENFSRSLQVEKQHQ